MITFKEVEKGYLVKVPYEIKDDFKAIFKTAKWSAGDTAWFVGPRSLKKLERFQEETKDALAEIEAKQVLEEEAELTQKEIDGVLKSLECISNNFEDLKTSIAKKKELLETLNAKRAEIESVKENFEAAQKENENLNKQIEEKIKGIIDVNDLETAIRKMVWSVKQGKSRDNRSYFEEAQEVFKDASNKLEEINMKSKMIDDIASANFNRSSYGDRDYVGKYSVNLDTVIQSLEEN
ncbi:hypothetical protein B0W47_16800 (plasmid) [Komagataeibacter nataicola]|uniref:Uncharacterized protein n=2 Tax=Komagataeibacter nataicola TaxID=265960 RepID=A0A9N7H3T6_9PROT|nr:hypothetical protein B0W47_16800 [Komagataeibacter nataicola]PYD66303.1 hypothetical protein CDI09_09145 [Komagataeibacter nataicola]